MPRPTPSPASRRRQQLRSSAAQAAASPTPTPATPATPPTPAPAPLPGLDDAKKLLDASAQTNRNLFLAFNLLLITGLTLCLSLDDAQLLEMKALIKLPVLTVDLPIWAFATLMPAILLGVHFDLLHNLKEHSRKLETWVEEWEKKYPRATTPSSTTGRERSISDQLFPFLYDFAWLYANQRAYRRASTDLLPNLCWLLYCWLPFTVQVIFLVRFADLQDYGYTAWHLLIVLLEAIWLVKFWPGFGERAPRRYWRWGLMALSGGCGLWSVVVLGLVLAYIDFDALSRENRPTIILDLLEIEGKIRKNLSISILPRLEVDEYRVKLDTNHFQIEKILHPGKTEDQIWDKTKRPLNLQGRRLAFADLSRAVIPRLGAAGAKLHGANLFSAQLHGANLFSAQLHGAYLRSAQLHGADLGLAQLHGANLGFAQLHGADLGLAQLHGANLFSAQLHGANLIYAGLHGADLGLAQLHGADLRKARLHGANLSFAWLHGANLSFAWLHGANLSFAWLHGANLSDAKLEGSFLENTKMQYVILNDNAQLAASAGQADWATEFNPQQWLNSAEVLAMSSATQAELKEKMKDAKESRADPSKLAPADPKKFQSAWLATLCQNEPTAKGMIRQLAFDAFSEKIHPIPRAKVHDWMQSQASCKPHLHLLEKIPLDESTKLPSLPASNRPNIPTQASPSPSPIKNPPKTP